MEQGDQICDQDHATDAAVGGAAVLAELLAEGYLVYDLPFQDPPSSAERSEVEALLDPWFTTVEAAALTAGLPVSRQVAWNWNPVNRDYENWVGIIRLRRPNGANYAESIRLSGPAFAGLGAAVARDWGDRRVRERVESARPPSAAPARGSEHPR